MKHRGTVLFSVLSFVLIFSAFETYRYLNYVQRQQVYQTLINDYRHPTKLTVQKHTKSVQSTRSKARTTSTQKENASARHRGSSLN
ncbi:hypothetical protein [Lactiplantibacillus songbeiensis]|uniref:Extracellular protein n=1 Tax=Lactiplantibacillus songbeiensis TaxID=2559920 RepID=A0ABW4C2H2_9LACO|nr:hypothetical protein [Lactiplantibacillus songbeiensis]